MPLKKKKRRRKTSKTDSPIEVVEVEETEEEEEEEMPEIEEDDDGIATVTPIPRRTTTRRQKEMIERGDQTLQSWLDSLGVHDNFKVKLERRKPDKVRDANGDIVEIGGYIDQYDEMLTEDDIKLTNGGGTYSVQVMRPDEQGRMVYFKSRTVKIPGHPIVDGVMLGGPRTKGEEDGGLGSRAFDFAQQMAQEGRRNGNGSNGETLALIQTMMNPLVAQVTQLQTKLTEKDTQLLKYIAEQGSKPDGSTDLMKSMWGQESGRVESLRAQHDSETRQLRENHREDLKREEVLRAAEINRLEQSHLREIDNLQRSHQGQLETTKLAYETRIDGLKSEIDKLNRDLGKTEAEVGELRARKDKSVADQAVEMTSVYQQLHGVFGGNEEERPKWYESLAQTVMENPEAIQRIIGGPPAPAQLAAAPQAQTQLAALPPVGQPYQTPDGRIQVRDEHGLVHDLTREQVIEIQQAQEKMARRPEPDEVKLAVRFMEAAVQGGKTTPAEFAESARNMIPADIMRFLEEEGPDVFLNDVAVLDPGSPLKTVNGRNFVRKVAKYLLEGTTE